LSVQRCGSFAARPTTGTICCKHDADPLECIGGNRHGCVSGPRPSGEKSSSPHRPPHTLSEIYSNLQSYLEYYGVYAPPTERLPQHPGERIQRGSSARKTSGFPRQDGALADFDDGYRQIYRAPSQAGSGNDIQPDRQASGRRQREPRQPSRYSGSSGSIPGDAFSSTCTPRSLGETISPSSSRDG
jgi:hypothetical protein